MVDAADSKSALGNKVLVRVRSSVMFEKYFPNKKLVCFDFDGILVNTEPLHYQAYLQTLSSLGYTVHINFEKYCSLAHNPDRLFFKKTIKKIFPDFNISWDIIREEKTKRYRSMLDSENVSSMIGVEDLIIKLHKRNIQTCIVTNSDRCDVDLIAKNHPFLHTIKKWITKDDYKNSKPSPDGYNLALQIHNIKKEDAIGLEDSPKGLQALKNAEMDAIFINTFPSDEQHHYQCISHLL